VCRDHFSASTGCVTCKPGYFIRRDPLKPFEDDTCNACPGGADNPCNGRGECDPSTGNCTCVSPWRGDACELPNSGGSPSPEPTPFIPTHLAIGAGGLIAVASGACVLGVAAVAFVSSLYRKNEARERASREKRRKRREEYDSLSVFSAQFSPPARRVDDDMMRHLLGTGDGGGGGAGGGEEASRGGGYGSFGGGSFGELDGMMVSDAGSKRARANSNPPPPLPSAHPRMVVAPPPRSHYQEKEDDVTSYPLQSPQSDRHSRDPLLSTSSSSRTSIVVDDHFKRPTAPLPGLRPEHRAAPPDLRRDPSAMSQTRERSDESFSSPTTAREWLVDVNNLTIHEQIGRGGSCLVYRATYDQLRVAVKSLALPSPQDFHSAEEYEYDLQDFRQEAKMLARLRHENIVQFYGIAFTPKTLLLVEEFCPLSLHDLMARPLRDTVVDRDNVLRTHERMTGRELKIWEIGQFGRGNSRATKKLAQEEEEEKDTWWTTFVPVVVEQIAQGMIFLHRSNCIHRDLKPENVLLNERGIFKICDFGVSRELHPNNNDGTDTGAGGGGSGGSGGSGSGGTSLGKSSSSSSSSGRVRGSPVGRLKSATLSITGQVGTPVFMAPEMFDERPTLLGHKLGYAIDVYSYGMLLWSLWAREQPYHRLLLSGEISNPYQIAMRVTQHHLRPTLRFRDHMGMHVPDMPHDIEVLAETCWDATPSKRPSFDQILKLLRSKR